MGVGDWEEGLVCGALQVLVLKLVEVADQEGPTLLVGRAALVVRRGGPYHTCLLVTYSTFGNPTPSFPP